MSLATHTRIFACLVWLAGLSACQTTGESYNVALQDPRYNATKNVEQQQDSADSLSASQETGIDLSGERETPNIEEFSLANLSPGHRPSLESDEGSLWMMVEREEDKLSTSGRLYRDPELNAYLQGLTCRIADAFCKDIRVYVVRNPLFNASMYPNGVMVIFTGLLLRAQNEAQVAAVIGHEIGHYLRRHSLKRMMDIRNREAGLMVFQLATIIAGIPQFNDLVTQIVVGGHYSYSRDNERESDGYGALLMHRAGYDPREASKVWDGLIRERSAKENKGSGALFFATHPPSEERSEALKLLASKIIGDGDPGKTGGEKFRKTILPHRALFLRDELAMRQFDTSEELLKILLEHGANKGELHYFLGEVYRLRNKEGDTDNALAAYEESELTEAAPPEMYRSRGLILWKTDKKRASADFKKYLELKPDAVDAQIIARMAEQTS